LNPISNALLAEIYKQESSDPFLSLMTLTHSSFGTLRFVANTVDIISRGNTYQAFPFKLTLPADDGETIKSITVEIDNVALELIDELRSVTGIIQVTIELVLASNPSLVEIEIGELKINNIEYNADVITASLAIDNFLSSELVSEKYTPTLYPGIFT